MRRSVMTSAEVIEGALQSGGHRYRAAMVTLTYREVGDWTADHIASFIKTARSWVERRGFALPYVWVAELQRRGAVHYHIVFWLPRGLTLPKPDKQGWWRHGQSSIEWARSPVRYLAKYASKGGVDSDHGFPSGCRTHARGGMGQAVHMLRIKLLPDWLKNQITPDDRVQRRCGGFLSKVSGIFYPTHWRIKERAADFSWFVFEKIEPPPRPYFPAVSNAPFGLPRQAIELQ